MHDRQHARADTACHGGRAPQKAAGTSRDVRRKSEGVASSCISFFEMHDATERDEKEKPATARRAGWIESMLFGLRQRHFTRMRVGTRTHACGQVRHQGTFIS